MVFLLIVRSERWSNLNRPTLNKMLVWRASTYPPITDPIPKKLLPFWESLFSFFLFFSNSVNKLFFKIIKSRFLIHRLLLYMHSYSETYKFSYYRSYLRFIERPNSLDMSEDKKNWMRTLKIGVSYLIQHPLVHVFWALKRTLSSRRFFWVPKIHALD